MPSYHNAAVCMRGHLVDDQLSLPLMSDDGFDQFCSACGASVIAECPNCHGDLRGAEKGWIPLQRPYPYCNGCGGALPWTEAAIEALTALLEEDGSLEEAEVTQLAESVGHLANETPTPDTTLAVSRFKRIVQKLGPGTRDAAVKIVTEVASAAVRGQLNP